MKQPDQLEKLADSLKKLPGIGRRTAERLARSLVVKKESLLKEILSSLETAANTLCCCSRCGSITAVDSNPCAICVDPDRDDSILCVVEDPGDVFLIEQAGGYHGRYHVLMGRVSPVHGQGIRNLKLDALVSRLDSGCVKELILALGSDVEGDATASLIREALSGRDVRITRPAMGLPAGSGISYCDGFTLSKAFNARQEL